MVSLHRKAHRIAAPAAAAAAPPTVNRSPNEMMRGINIMTRLSRTHRFALQFGYVNDRSGRRFLRNWRKGIVLTSPYTVRTR
jgi:hypothetical protein